MIPLGVVGGAAHQALTKEYLGTFLMTPIEGAGKYTASYTFPNIGSQLLLMIAGYLNGSNTVPTVTVGGVPVGVDAYVQHPQERTLSTHRVPPASTAVAYFGGYERCAPSVAVWALSSPVVPLDNAGLVNGNGTASLSVQSVPGGMAVAGTLSGTDWPTQISFAGITQDATVFNSSTMGFASDSTDGSIVNSVASFHSYGEDISLLVSYA